MTMEDRLLQTLRSVFGDDLHELKDADGLGTITGWDSAGHLSLIMALEAEFQVEFETDDFAELVNIGAIRKRLAEE